MSIKLNNYICSCALLFDNIQSIRCRVWKRSIGFLWNKGVGRVTSQT